MGCPQPAPPAPGLSPGDRGGGLRVCWAGADAARASGPLPPRVRPECGRGGTNSDTEDIRRMREVRLGARGLGGLAELAKGLAVRQQQSARVALAADSAALRDVARPALQLLPSGVQGKQRAVQPAAGAPRRRGNVPLQEQIGQREGLRSERRQLVLGVEQRRLLRRRRAAGRCRLGAARGLSRLQRCMLLDHGQALAGPGHE
mmetsp:Transcript_70629/g.197059  ORF Transcript_70629/g.197059 Transcript_70629/m.197059 type:complete len:203 (-) Transcript_70629:69-677(-)